MSPLATVLFCALLFSSSCVGVSLSAFNTGPVVELSYGSFQGNATGDLVKFLGMPFAAPPYASIYPNLTCGHITDRYPAFLAKR